jgi:hypothetical protein
MIPVAKGSSAIRCLLSRAVIRRIQRSRRGSLIVGSTDRSDGHEQQELGGAGIPAKKPSNDVSIGNFDILAAYSYAHALLDGGPALIHAISVTANTFTLTMSDNYNSMINEERDKRSARL